MQVRVGITLLVVADVLLVGALVSFGLAGLLWMMRRAYAPVFILRVPSERTQRRAFVGSIATMLCVGAGLLAWWLVVS